MTNAYHKGMDVAQNLGEEFNVLNAYHFWEGMDVRYGRDWRNKCICVRSDFTSVT